MKFPAYPSRPHKSGQARVRIAGRDHYLGVFDSPESHAEYARLRREFERSGPPPSRCPTVAEVVARWLLDAERERGPDSRELREFRRLFGVLLPVYGNLDAGLFDAAKLDELRTIMAERWCRNVTNRQTVRLKTVWRWAESKQLVPPGSWSQLRSLAPIPRNSRRFRQTEPRQPVPWSQVEAVIPCLPPVVAAMVLLQWWTGMRPGEVIVMRREDVDANSDVWSYRLAGGKNAWRGIEDVVSIGPEAQKILRPWLEAVKSGYLFPPSRRRRNAHYSVEAYAQAIRRGCTAAKVERWHPYQLRHAAAARLTLECGLDAARAQLRQKSLAVTHHYARSADHKLAQDAARKAG